MDAVAGNLLYQPYFGPRFEACVKASVDRTLAELHHTAPGALPLPACACPCGLFPKARRRESEVSLPLAARKSTLVSPHSSPRGVEVT